MLTLLLAWRRRRALAADPRFVVRAAARQATVHAAPRRYEVRA